MQYLLEQCLLLDAVFNETLRLTTGASSARNVDSTTTVGTKMLLVNAKISIPYRQLDYDEDVFRPAVLTFSPSRFLDNKELRKSLFFKPFGGGTTFCSGHFIAKRRILALTTVILTQYEVEFGAGDVALPVPKMTKPTLGVMDPAGDEDVLIKIRPMVY